MVFYFIFLLRDNARTLFHVNKYLRVLCTELEVFVHNQRPWNSTSLRQTRKFYLFFELNICQTTTFFQSTFITVCDSQEAAKNTLSEYGPYLVSQVVKVSRFHWLFYLCQKVNGLPKVNRGHRKQLDEYQRFCEAGPKKSEDYLRTHGNYRKSPEVFVFVFTELNHVFSAFGAECMIFRQA